MKITKNQILFSWSIIISGLVIPYFIDYTKDLLYNPIVFIFLLYFLVLFGAFSREKYIDLSEKELKNEYKLIVETRHLTPENLNFTEMQPGETLKTSLRPYYKKYIHRKAIQYDSSPVNKDCYTEQELAELFKQNRNILLIGNPTEGKTRTLFEVLKMLNNFFVISLPINSSPSDKALQLLAEKKVIWLFDDLNSYESNSFDFQHTFNKLKKITSVCVLAATCRDGPELKKSILDNTGQLNKIYDLFDYKLTLIPANNDQKEELKKAINETENKLFPTIGSICMSKHFEFMRQRFELLPELDKNTFRAIGLLFSGFIYPFTLQRIRCVLSDIFGHEKNNIDEPTVRASLNNLVVNGFVISPRDVFPIIPEAAYFTEHEIEYYYQQNLQDDKVSLIDCFKKHKDADGLMKMASSHCNNGDLVAAMNIWDVVINEFTYSEEISLLLPVAESMFNKGWIFDQIGRPPYAIKCYDDLVKRFENSQESVLQIMVAKALFNQGWANHLLKEYDDEIKCYDHLINRFSTSDVLELKNQICKAIVHKSNYFYMLGKPDEGQKCIDGIKDVFCKKKY